MKVTFNLNKKYFYSILAVLIIVGGLLVVNAVLINPSNMAVPNPGHPLENVQGLFTGDTSLRDSYSKICQKDGTNCPATLFISTDSIKIPLFVLQGGSGTCTIRYEGLQYVSGSGDTTGNKYINACLEFLKNDPIISTGNFANDQQKAFINHLNYRTGKTCSANSVDSSYGDLKI